MIWHLGLLAVRATEARLEATGEQGVEEGEVHAQVRPLRLLHLRPRWGEYTGEEVGSLERSGHSVVGYIRYLLLPHRVSELSSGRHQRGPHPL